MQPLVGGTHYRRRQVRRDGGGRHAGLSPRPRGPRRFAASQLPTASVTHFLVKLVFAAPASFFSAACLSQPAAASVSHFFMKLVFAAPASFFSVDCMLQLVCA